ncbi:MAG TPA: AzlC family ABC transporter permease [Acidimicrobiia bacterium]|nr:AzlC family ABC transporter permease [Acidimicrobiia bacterium]
MESRQAWIGAMRAGAVAVAPQLIGVIPFGLVAGATPADGGLGAAAAVGFSTVVFAGASQLAAIDVLTHGGTVLVAVLAACTINLRMMLYSASLAPYLTRDRLRWRMLASYLLVDQVYALAVTRWSDPDDPVSAPEARIPFMIGAGLLLWASWQTMTLVGAAIGAAVPESLPLAFAVPLVFLVLLVPSVSSRPAAVAALGGGLGAVVAAESGAGHTSLMIGAIVGIAAGALAELAAERRAT